jgi:hypothetical protein
MNHYHFNPRKFLLNVIAPVQFCIGLLLLYGAAGASDADMMDAMPCIGLGFAGALIILSTALYIPKRKERRKRYEVNRYCQKD